jgi:hypothetical protein
MNIENNKINTGIKIPDQSLGLRCTHLNEETQEI